MLEPPIVQMQPCHAIMSHCWSFYRAGGTSSIAQMQLCHAITSHCWKLVSLADA